MNTSFPTVAIADDHELFRQAAVTVLSQIGFRVILEAADGLDLLSLLSHRAPLPDVSVLDIDMPFMDGYETARRLQREFPSIKIVALTQFYDRDKERSILEAGAVTMLTKGSDPGVWKEAILKNFWKTR
ncbi:MAG TPA: response regulator transcription factor [Puia sp.]|nr:response regulator transcription factor [Puia sp.]